MSIPDSLIVLSWSEASPLIRKVNPELWGNICTVDGVEKMEFVRARYPYGVDLSSQGQFYLYDNGEQTFLNKAPSKVKELLNYGWRTFPAGLVIKGSVEVLLKFEGLIIPRIMVREGMTFSLLSVMDYEKTQFLTQAFYAGTSGCRSILMLPSILHEQSSQRLVDRYGVSENKVKPTNLNEFFNLFTDLLKNEKGKSNWYSEVIFFPKTLMKSLEKPGQFSNFVYKKTWKFTEFNRYHFLYDAIWQQFLYQAKRKFTIDLSIITAASKIILIALGQDPGFIPLNDDRFGPISILSKIFYDDYRIRYNAPVMMAPGHITTDNPVYFSMHYYEVLNGFQTIHKIKSLSDFKVVESLVKYFIEYIQKIGKVDGETNLMGIADILSHTEFNFFFQKQSYGDIPSLWQQDSRFLGVLHPNKELGFPGHSTFFQGCVRIKRTKLAQDIYR